MRNSSPLACSLVVLVGSLVGCSQPAGPFVTVSITGIPVEATQVSATAMLGDELQSNQAPTMGPTLSLTLDAPAGARGSLVISAAALLASSSCQLATGMVKVELNDDIAYGATLALADAPLAGCTGLPTVGLTLNKVETGGAGSVSSIPSGITCAVGAACTQAVARYRPDTTVKLVAKPALGSQVTWSEPTCGPTHVCTVTMSQDRTVTATFVPCASKSWCDEGPAEVTGELYGVWGTSGNVVYAVGDAGTIAQRSGAHWDLMTSGVTVPLRAVGGDGATPAVYAGGDGGTVLTLTPPSKWDVVTQPLLAGQQITGIASDRLPVPFNPPSLNIYFSTDTGGFYLKNGTSWTTITDAALQGKVLHAVSATNGSSGREATVVGEAGLVLRRVDYFGPRTADNTPGSQTTAALRGVWSGSSLSVAVGDNGVIITRGTQDYNNNTRVWKLVPSPVTGRLNGVWGGDDKNIWIVGDGGVILKYDGNMGVTLQMNVPTVDLFGVWAADSNPANVYAVGRNGVILHYQP